MYSDRDIHEEILRRSHKKIDVQPYNPERLQPASLDLRLGWEFLIPLSDPASYAHNIVPEKEIVVGDGMEETRQFPYRRVDLADQTVRYAGQERGIVVNPDAFMLASTLETVTVGPMVSARVEGKSSLGRIGLLVHLTAGFIDPGFSGKITLEIKNLSRRPIRIIPGTAICQICFTDMKSPPLKPYGVEKGSHYQGQKTVTASRFAQEI